MKTKHQLPSYVKKYFWEVDAEKLDPARNPEYLALRILEYGDFQAVRWLLKNINKKVIKEAILKRRGLSLRDRAFWALFFGFPKQCLKKFYQEKQKSLWPY